jgi:hypothetical protein
VHRLPRTPRPRSAREQPRLHPSPAGWPDATWARRASKASKVEAQRPPQRRHQPCWPGPSQRKSRFAPLLSPRRAAPYACARCQECRAKQRDSAVPAEACRRALRHPDGGGEWSCRRLARRPRTRPPYRRSRRCRRRRSSTPAAIRWCHSKWESLRAGWCRFFLGSNGTDGARTAQRTRTMVERADGRLAETERPTCRPDGCSFPTSEDMRTTQESGKSTPGGTGAGPTLSHRTAGATTTESEFFPDVAGTRFSWPGRCNRSGRFRAAGPRPSRPQHPERLPPRPRRHFDTARGSSARNRTAQRGCGPRAA